MCAWYVQEWRQAEGGLRNKLQEVKNKLQQTTDVAEQQNTIIVELESQLKHTSDERAVLQRSIASLSIDTENFRDALSNIAGSASQLQQRLEPALQGVGISVQRATGALDASSAYTSTGRRQATDSGVALVQRAENAIQDLLQLTSACGEAAQRLNREVKDARSESAGMKTRIEAVDDVANTAQERARALMAAEQTVQELRSAVAAAQSQLSVAQSELVSVRQRNTDLQRESDKAASKVAALVQEIELCKKNELEAKTLVAATQKRAAELEGVLNRVHRDADAMASHNARLETATYRENGRYAELSAEIAAANAAKQRAETAVLEARAQINKLRQVRPAAAGHAAHMTATSSYFVFAQDASDARAELANSMGRIAEMQELLGRKERELQETRDQAAQLAFVRAPYII
jgi:chromosome segregation ATPase